MTILPIKAKKLKDSRPFAWSFSAPPADDSWRFVTIRNCDVNCRHKLTNFVTFTLTL